MAFLLFDLDGTLTDPAQGIASCMQHAMRLLGHAAPEAAALTQFIGPPLRHSFAELLGADDGHTLDEAMMHYRERYASVGLYENVVYPFIPPGLAQLRAAGHRMWIATSKPTLYAERIVEHFSLREYFDGIYGSELSGERSDKAELIAHVLERERLAPNEAWMIGDRRHDVIGGIANGTHTAGALWGYGSQRELADAGAEILIDGLEGLNNYLA